jgi:hypothetical protein
MNAQVREEWRKVHIDERHNLCALPGISRAMKSRRMRLTGHVTRIGERKTTYSGSFGKT